MRRRLVFALAGVAIVTLLLYATPRAFMVADFVRRAETKSLQRSLALITRATDERIAAGQPVDTAFVQHLAQRREQIVVRLADGTVVRSRAVTRGGTVTKSQNLAVGGRAELRVPSAAIDNQVAKSLTSIYAVGAAAIAFAVLVALLLSRRLAQPFTALVEYANGIGSDADEAPRSTIPEANRLAEALERSNERLARMMEQEREFSSNASHQLRTPLAALRLRLEAIAMWPPPADELHAEVNESIEEVDRLTATVDDLLSLAREGRIGVATQLDLRAASAAAAARWKAEFDQAGRSLRIEPTTEPVPAETSERALYQVMDVLLENALVHGAGSVNVEVATNDDRALIRVGDEGVVAEADAHRMFERSYRSTTSAGSGIGLALAQSIVESAGGRLRLVENSPTTFELSFATA